ncbi:MAG: DUF6712 family protein [Bacteroidales bacterium]
MLFNKDLNGQEEMKSLLGFIYASKNFTNMTTDIILATDDLISLLGNDLYSEIEDFYLSDDYDSDPEPPVMDTPEGEPVPTKDLAIWRELVKRTQHPIAFYAYRAYAASGDLTHSDKGRQIFVSETEKPAFEWMIMRDDQSMLTKAHKLTDRLLSFLDENKDETFIKEKWTDSNAYKAFKNNLVCDAASFDAIFPINQSRRFFLKVLPFIKEVERSKIIPVITYEVWESLITYIQSGDSDSDKEELLNNCRIPLVHYTMAIAARRLAAEILPDGVFQSYVSGSLSAKAKNPVNMEFKTEIAAILDKQGDEALTYLQQFLALKAAEVAGTDYTGESLTERHSSDNQFFRM